MFFARLAAAAVLGGLVLGSAPVGAEPISQVVVLGDSLSDNGTGFYAVTTAAATAGVPGVVPFPFSPPYDSGRFSNGPVAVERLAQQIGAPLVDLAQGGATTGIGNSLDGGSPTAAGALQAFGSAGLTTQFQNYVAAHGATFDPEALFVVWAETNNLLGALSNPATPPAEMLALINQAVTQIVSVTTALMLGGAQNILVPGLPDLGLAPQARLGGPAAMLAGTLVTDVFNAALSASLDIFTPNATSYDTAGFLRSIIATPSSYGFANVTTGCKPGLTGGPVPPGSVLCSDPASYVFWDNLHPTAAAHSLLGTEFARAVPEPTTLALVAAGLALALARRRSLRS